MASAADLLQEVGLPGSATSLGGSGYTIGATSITVGSTSNWPTNTGVTFAIDRAEVINGVEQRIDGTYCEFVGVVSSGTSVTSVSKQFGTDQDYPAGTLTRVYIPVSSERENRIVEWGTEQHNQDGTHSDVTATSLSVTGNVTLANNKITAPMLATSAIKLGYTAGTSNVSTTSSSPTTLSLATTVTIPAGGRSVRITFFTGQLSNSVANTNTQITLWDGTVGSGTQLQTAFFASANANNATMATVSAIVTPSAGSKTYNAAIANIGGGTATSYASSTMPMYLLVEAI